MYNSTQTKKTYRWALTNFFKIIYGKNEGELDEHAEKYFSEKRDYQEDIQKFLSEISDRPPKSVRLMVATVKTFLIENDIELPQRFWRRLSGRIKGSRARTLDKVPSNVQFRKIIGNLPPKGKALYLTLASSGMRIGEALQLQLDDLDLDVKPMKVRIRGEYTKAGNPRIAFISCEAGEMVQDWLRLRDDYLKTANGRSTMYDKSANDKRIFPFESNTAYIVWKNALKKVGLHENDKSTKRLTIRPHVLMKFFRTKMATLIPVDIVEALMGHEGYLTEVYRRYSQKDLAKFYLQGESALTIFGGFNQKGFEAKIEKFETEIKLKVEAKAEEQNKQLQSIVNGLTSENMAMRSRVQSLEPKVKELATEVEAQKRKWDWFWESMNLTSSDLDEFMKMNRDFIKRKLVSYDHDANELEERTREEWLRENSKKVEK